MFGLSERRDPCEAMVAIAHCEGRRIGLIVDELIGQQQVVIKSLGERFEKLQGICGGAILGDGRVGLILEMTGLEAAHNAMRCRDQAGFMEGATGAQWFPAKTSVAQGEEAACREAECRPELVMN
jgi:chemotaxis protein histidine kinase CheA